VFSLTCHVNSPKEALSRLFENDAAIDRVAMVGTVCLGRSRIFGGVSRLAAWDRHSPERYDVLPTRQRIVRSDSAMRRGDSHKSDEEGSSDRPAVHDHRDMRVRSVIDAHLWDRAKWIGTAYGDMGPDEPPWFGLMFTDGDAGTRIFERWRERFGDVDEDEEIYISIVRKFSAEHPTHYGLIVTSKVQDDERLSMVASRTNVMHPSDDINLSRFLTAYRRSGAYLLMPAIYSGSGAPSFLRDLALMKRALSAKDAVDITAADIESAHLRLFRS
jgi:hypothetical protein